MTTISASLRPWIRVASFGLTLALAACSGTVVGGGGGDGAGPTCQGPCEEPLPEVPVPRAIAITAAQLGWGSGGAGGSCGGSGTGGSGSSGGFPCGGPPYADTVYLEVGNPSPSCGDPQPSVGCGPNFGVSIGIPAAMLQPGVLQLSDPALLSTFSEAGPAEQNPSVCPFGGGSFNNGTLTIVSVDATSVTFTLAGTALLDLGGGIADGTYTAPRCP